MRLKKQTRINHYSFADYGKEFIDFIPTKKGCPGKAFSRVMAQSNLHWGKTTTTTKKTIRGKI